MTHTEILKTIDHTALKSFTTWSDIEKLCNEALEFKTASVCIPPSYVKRVCEKFKNLNVCTVIGFPLGYNDTDVKVFETKKAILDGASEIDMVINMGDVKNKDFDKILNEIIAIKQATGDKILKVIIETCYLTQEEKIKLCEIVTKANAEFIKTSTGFGTNGATLDDILLFKKHIGENVSMKAAGGVKNVSDIENFLNAGCSRIGTSSAVDILKGNDTNGY